MPPAQPLTWGRDLSGSPDGAGGIGGLLAVQDANGTTTGENHESDDLRYVYFYDANGNVGQVIDLAASSASASIKAHYEYDAYGNVLVQSGSYASANPYRFSTKPWDDETGLGYWGQRYYDPRLGRWINHDPIGELGGLNLYAYVFNDPIGVVDPLGRLSLAGPWEWNPCPQSSQPTSPPTSEPSSQPTSRPRPCTEHPALQPDPKDNDCDRKLKSIIKNNPTLCSALNDSAPDGEKLRIKCCRGKDLGSTVCLKDMGLPTQMCINPDDVINNPEDVPPSVIHELVHVKQCLVEGGSGYDNYDDCMRLETPAYRAQLKHVAPGLPEDFYDKEAHRIAHDACKKLPKKKP